MADETATKGRIIAAALRLAGEKPWQDVTLSDIASAAGVNLAELRREFGGKPAIVAAFMRTIDDQILAERREFSAGQSPRDRLFDVIMSRFDALARHKTGVRSIARSRPCDPALLRSLCASQAWMLAAAGIPTDGLMGPLRVGGLASVYASVFRVWLDDDDPGQARTMAALDKRLQRGEQALGAVGDFCRAVCKVADALSPRRRSEPETKPEPPPAAQSSPAP